MTERLRPQVEPDHYGAGYDARFIAYHHQARVVLAEGAQEVLEVGVGSGFLARHLRSRGIPVLTCDLDPRLEPDVVAELSRGLPFPDDAVDTVTCFEVLEHLPWERVGAALQELARVARRRVLISVPDWTPHYHLSFALPLLGTRRWVFTIPWTPLVPWRRPVSHAFDGQHYWELGKAEFPESGLRSLVEQRFRIHRDFRPLEHTFHHFYVLEPRPGGDVGT